MIFPCRRTATARRSIAVSPAARAAMDRALHRRHRLVAHAHGTSASAVAVAEPKTDRRAVVGKLLYHLLPDQARASCWRTCGAMFGDDVLGETI